MTHDFVLVPPWVPPRFSCSSHPPASQSWPSRQEKHSSGTLGRRGGPQFRPSGGETFRVREVRTRSGWGNSSGRGDPPRVTNWATWTKLRERCRSACKIQSVTNLSTSQCPSSLIQPRGRPSELRWTLLGIQLPAPALPGLIAPRVAQSRQSAEAGSSPRARPADPSPAPPTPAGLGWGCDLTNGPFGGACSEIPASQPSMAEGWRP